MKNKGKPQRLKSKPQRAQRYRRVHKVKTLRSLRSLCVLCGFVFFFHTAAYSQSDKFGGIGVSVDIDSSVMQPYIVDILSGKPGAMAGLRSGDHIISINHWKTKGKLKEQVANKLRGKIGSQVDLDIGRGGKQMDFVMKREKIVVNEKTGNLCEGLDTILKSTIDTFSAIIDSDKIIWKEQMMMSGGRNREWESKLHLAGFMRNEIDKDDDDIYFKAVYFIGKDSLEALNKYNRVMEDIKDCFPYTICKSYNTDINTMHQYLTTSFKITDVRNNKYKSLVGSTVTLWFGHDYSSFFEVWLDCYK